MGKFFWIWEDVEQDWMEVDILKKSDIEENIWQVAVDILESEEEITILAPIAWIDLEDIDLSFNKSILTISWERKKPYFYNNSVKVRNSECFWWKFVRNIILPENIDFDSIRATMENNLLIVTIRLLVFPSKEIKINKVEW